MHNVTCQTLTYLASEQLRIPYNNTPGKRDTASMCELDNIHDVVHKSTYYLELLWIIVTPHNESMYVELCYTMCVHKANFSKYKARNKTVEFLMTVPVYSTQAFAHNRDHKGGTTYRGRCQWWARRVTYSCTLQHSCMRHHECSHLWFFHTQNANSSLQCKASDP